MNYYDILLAKKLEDDRDPKVEGLSVTANGTYSEEGKVYKPVVVNVAGYSLEDMPSGAISSFTDGTDTPLNKLEVGIEPVQDLHGYDAPWVGGGGKNLLPMTVESIKAINPTGTWDGNVYTLYGVSYTLNVDNAGNIGSITVNGTATQYSLMRLVNEWTNSDDTILNGAATGSSASGYKIQADSSSGVKQDVGNGVTLPAGYLATRVIIVVPQNITASNAIFKPMARLASVIDATFAPYSNICPISGWSAVDVTVADDVDNPTTTKTITIQLGDTYYGDKLDVVSGVMTKTHEYIASYNGETLPSTWISDRDVYASGTTPTTGAEVVYELATPTTIQLTPTQVRSLLGNNNIFADTGNIIEGQYFKSL